jgi:hypothetical protein
MPPWPLQGIDAISHGVLRKKNRVVKPLNVRNGSQRQDKNVIHCMFRLTVLGQKVHEGPAVGKLPGAYSLCRF